MQPSPPSLPPEARSPRHWLLGTAYHAQREPLRWIPRWIAEYGDIFRVVSPFGQASVVSTPELAHQVLVERYSHYQNKSRSYAVLRILMGNGLVTSSGEFWRRQRKLVQPAFHRRRLDTLFNTMLERTLEVQPQLAAAAKSGQVIDLTPLLSGLTLDIFGRAMFGTDVQGDAANVSSYITTLNEHALRLLRRPWLFLLPRRFPTPFTRKPVHALKSLDAMVHGIIQSRRRTPGDHDDLLALLINATEEDTGRGMTDAQLRDEVMTLFVAGHETTANAMAWLLHLVATHPEVEQHLHAEIDSLYRESGPDLTSLANFTYTRQVIEESLRLYPSIWSIGRQCTQEDVLGGYRVPVGMNVVVPIFHFHRSERFWKEPLRFDPDRFSPQNRPTQDPPCYFPFGAGPRVCIGNHFAMQELMVMTLVFARHFRFRMAADARVEADPLITLRPKHGMRMRIEAR